MNTKPIKTIFADTRSIHGCSRAFVFSCVALGILMSTGCVDSEAAKTPIEPVRLESLPANTSVEAISKVASTSIENTDSQEVQEETKEDSASGVLGAASKLLEQAKSKGGSTASGASKWVQDKINGAADAGNQSADETWDWANETFESLKSQGLTTAKSTSEWLGQDWNNMESWEYKVITLAGTDEKLAQQLNKFGKQGWDCFNTEANAEGTRFYFKKPIFSYLRQLPFKDVIKLVPMMNNEGN